jgi:hypothetical protein
MSRSLKVLLIPVVVLFVLACNFVTQPVRDAQNLAETAQSVITSIPIQTLEALPSAIPSVIPMETLEALPSAMPTFEAIATQFGNVLDPQGPPAQEWKGIPIMPQATAGQEFTQNDSKIYSFKAGITAKDVQDFYKEKLTPLGWSQTSFPSGTDTGITIFSKENNTLVITVIPSDNAVVVLLALS